MNCYLKFFGILTLLLFFSHHLLADEIHLKNGDRMSGQLHNLSSTLCTFATSYQAILHLKPEQILWLHTSVPVAVELRSGERLIGTLTTEPGGRFSLHSQRLGILTLQLAEIKAIEGLNNGKILKPAKELLNQKIFPDMFKVQGRGEGTSKPVASEEKSPTPKTIGEKEDRQRLFLPQSEVLLVKKGEKELDISASYVYDQSTNNRARNLVFPLELHLGITDRLEGFVRLPITWAEQETFSEGHFEKNNNFGIGDISMGALYLFAPEQEKRPEMIGSLNVTAPTGEKPDYTDPNQVSLGNGHWEITTGLTLVKSYEPALLFGNIGYTHSFANTFNDIRIAPGDSFSYMFGSGFMVNNKLAMFSQFLGTYQTEGERDGIKILGSVYEPMLLQNYLTYSLGKNSYIQPSVTFGLNDDAPDVILELSYFYTF